MRTLNKLSDGLERAWDHLAEGWRDLMGRAKESMTFFERDDSADDKKSLAAVGSGRWGVVAADLSDHGNSLRLRLEVPGLDSDELDIEVDDDVLIVSGEKRYEHEEKVDGWLRRECAYGRFSRRIALPVEVDESKAKANYRRGVLTIDLPKRPEVMPRRIAVNAS